MNKISLVEATAMMVHATKTLLCLAKFGIQLIPTMVMVNHN